jgi:hypothetical protein
MIQARFPVVHTIINICMFFSMSVYHHHPIFIFRHMTPYSNSVFTSGDLHWAERVGARLPCLALRIARPHLLTPSYIPSILRISPGDCNTSSCYFPNSPRLEIALHSPHQPALAHPHGEPLHIAPPSTYTNSKRMQQ